MNSGDVVVSMASHPRELLKARSTAKAVAMLVGAQNHLGHMFQRLRPLRKRNLAELEFWSMKATGRCFVEAKTEVEVL
jgi:hypothetical protein